MLHSKPHRLVVRTIKVLKNGIKPEKKSLPLPLRIIEPKLFILVLLLVTVGWWKILKERFFLQSYFIWWLRIVRPFYSLVNLELWTSTERHRGTRSGCNRSESKFGNLPYKILVPTEIFAKILDGHDVRNLFQIEAGISHLKNPSPSFFHRMISFWK